ncbi:MAG: hypothetical protein NTX31_03845 [Burkholderiales bacterium]|nr:hypothetical protein [Burkholderiales bacterium]
MIKITVNNSVLEKLSSAFPKPPNSAKRALAKYIGVLEEKLFESLGKGRSEYARKLKAYSIPVDKLSGEGGRIGANKIRLHAWLEQNNLALVKTVVLGTNRTGVVSLVKLTDLVTMTDDMAASQLGAKTSAELDAHLDEPSDSDGEFVSHLFPDMKSLTEAEVFARYDITEIDVESLKHYIRWLLTKANKLTPIQKENNLRQAQIILRVAQFSDGLFFQRKKASFFGRTYYEGISVQGVHKSLREAMIGNCYEYDIKSSVIAWKAGFARACFAQMKSTKTFEDEFSATLLYLEKKKAFTDAVITDTFTSDSKSDHDHQLKLIKQAVTAMSFGARLTVKGWQDDCGAWTNPAIVDIIKNGEERSRFAKSKTIKKFSAEQKTLDSYIFGIFIKANPQFSTCKDLQTGSGRISKSKVMAYLYQHAETAVMDIVRAELKTLGRTVLANIHDAIIIRHKLSAYDREEIEYKMRASTGIDYWRLGETKLKRYKLVSNEALEDEKLHKQRMAAEMEKAKNYKPKNF